jgi:hypothetical protein
VTAAWRVLAESWPLAWPRARLRELVGAEALAALEASGVATRGALGAGEAYPCRCPADAGCAMRLVEEDGLVAVCALAPAECPDERVADEDAVRVHVDATSLGRFLQRAVGLAAAPVREQGGAAFLGERVVGRAEVRVWLVPRPARWLDGGGLDRALDEDPDRVLLALALHRGAIPAGAPRRRRNARVAWVPLAEALDLDRGALDLAETWLAVAPEAELGPELWPRYAVVADPQRSAYWYAGRRLGIDRSPTVERLLVALLERAGEWVARSWLIGTLWPDADRERPKPTDVQLERRLRQLKSDLSAAFVALPPVPGAALDPIENRRLADDAAGSYRLDVARSRVLWRSRP